MPSHSRPSTLQPSRPHCPGSQPTPDEISDQIDPLTTHAINAREAAVLPHILLCTKDASRLQFDWATLAQRMGMRNPRSAANAWLAVRKKMAAVSSAAADSAPPSPRLTHNDQRFLANAVLCTKRALDLDYAALALRLGMTNPRSASNAWGAIRKKIAAGSEAAVGGGPAVQRTAVKRRRPIDHGTSSTTKMTTTRTTTTTTTTSQIAAAKVDRHRVQSPEMPATVQPFSSFKVFKCEGESMKTEEKRPDEGFGFAKADPVVSAAYGLSTTSQVLSTRHAHVPSLGVAADKVDQDRVRVKSEPFGEC